MTVRRKRRPRKENPWWTKSGLTERQEHVFRVISIALVSLMSVGWSYAIYDGVVTPSAAFTAEKFKNGKVVAIVSAAQPTAAPAASEVAAAMLTDRTSTAFLTDAALAFLTPLRGHSGKVYVTMRTPGARVADESDPHMQARYTARGGETVTSDEFTAPQQPGVYNVAVELNRATRELDDLRLITLVPFSEKQNGRIGPYFLGNWPYERGGRPKSAAYANPEGFIEVTPQNRDVPVSEHFKLGDFLTKDQPNVWPKYLLLRPQLIDKLELVIKELEANGVEVKHLQIMSGFRTPRYNVGGGNTAGRASLSRHMYGDASDVFVDNNRDGYTDDVNGDGRIDVRDSEFVGAMAERVEKKYPSLVGGVGVYVACCGHGPFTHIDVRGYRARWRGSGNG